MVVQWLPDLLKGSSPERVPVLHGDQPWHGVHDVVLDHEEADDLVEERHVAVQGGWLKKEWRLELKKNSNFKINKKFNIKQEKKISK